jgi:uncharacterized membrane protein
MRRIDLRLLIAAVITVACGAGLLFAKSGPIAVVAGLPIVFLLPGLAVMAAVFPIKPWRGDLFAWAVGISLASDILLGVLVNQVASLTRQTEITALSVASLVGFSVAAIRRMRRRFDTVASSDKHSRPRLRRLLSPAIVLPALVTVAAVCTTCWLSVSSGHAQNTATFTELWLSPGQGAAAATTDLGVRNDEGRPTDYRLLLSTSIGTTDWDLQLQPTQTWHVPVTIPADGQATAELYRGGTDTPYRVVNLSPGD